MMHILQNQAFGALMGYLAGFISAAWVLSMVRCDNCCQNSSEDDDAAYWSKKLDRRKGDK